MPPELTLQRAIRKGIYQLGVTPVLIMFTIPCVTYLVVERIYNINLFPLIYLGIFFISTVPGWLWWSLRAPKWKVWAYSNIDPSKINELKTKAITLGLIWSDRSKINKTEIWSRKDKEKMKDILKKIESN